ncbi:HK97 family phage prohead protease [Jiella marina]|uniref:HK97 family phage prohead protease n=1 Tax=Jiella sp. LLJ827 TaxID=2917712 RepID=UPI002101C3E8|nr:HK97 family phage prohead protease [Jiella sp. LLJ827]MCQ0986494.1 HK97 family phage prohead protease [Jiella sp. LLJ827]
MSFQPLHFETKAVSDDGTFEGIASTPTVDLGGDIVAPGAFKASLADHVKRGTRPIMLRDHNMSEVIGVWSSVEETSAGLSVKGKLTLAVAKAAETLALLKDNAIQGLSIGFRTRESTRDQKTGVRTLTKIDLFEISVVAIPMNPEARVVAVKAADITTQREFEVFLRDAGFTRAQAKVLSKGFRQAAPDLRDADPDAVASLAQLVKQRAEAIMNRSVPNGH